MPHRTTYIFPRQFDTPSSSKFCLDHEKKSCSSTTSPIDDVKSDDVSSYGSQNQCLTGDKIHGNQLAAFVNWLAEKKRKDSSVVVHNHHVKIITLTEEEEEGEEEEFDIGGDIGKQEKQVLIRRRPLSPPDQAVPAPPLVKEVSEVEQVVHGVGGGGLRFGIDRQVSNLRRLSSSGSNFSGYGSSKERGSNLQRLSSTGSNLSGYGSVKEKGIDRQVSLQRLSSVESGLSYAGSLFSGPATTLDGDWSCITFGIKDSMAETREEVEEEEVEAVARRRPEVNDVSDDDKESEVQRLKESYCLQLSLARKISEQASLASAEPLLLQDCRSSHGGSYDAQTVSYRLWVLFLSISSCFDWLMESHYSNMAANTESGLG